MVTKIQKATSPQVMNSADGAPQLTKPMRNVDCDLFRFHGLVGLSKKKRDRGALQDRPDLYQGPCNPGEKCNAPGAACDKQENVASVHRQTTTHSNNSFLTRRASESDRLNLYTNQQRLELGNESSSVSSSRESLTTASRQTPLAGASTATSNKHSINNILRSGYTGSESSGRLTTGPTMV